MGYIKTKFAYGEKAKIQKRAQEILKEMGIENWEISHTVTSYHAHRHNQDCATPIGMVVREVTRKLLESKAKKTQLIAELAA